MTRFLIATALLLASAPAADAQARNTGSAHTTRAAATAEAPRTPLAESPSVVQAAAPARMDLPRAESRSVGVERRVEMRSTAYCLRGTTRTGVRVRDGIAAGDPNVLPLGSVVRVSHTDGRLIGVFVIMDTGGAVRGNKIDLWFSSCAEAEDWGIRSVITEVLDIGRAS
ncbi:3D domain-containing protein [Longimicrobium sp.]|jgi:cystine transport system substrate-binding protein|uniref:3D domain-containing protein n=1 Tax=Longimicrobium sp. TaxID=2029185 RepID=UPI002ED78B53